MTIVYRAFWILKIIMIPPHYLWLSLHLYIYISQRPCQLYLPFLRIFKHFPWNLSHFAGQKSVENLQITALSYHFCTLRFLNCGFVLAKQRNTSILHFLLWTWDFSYQKRYVLRLKFVPFLIHSCEMIRKHSLYDGFFVWFNSLHISKLRKNYQMEGKKWKQEKCLERLKPIH